MKLDNYKKAAKYRLIFPLLIFPATIIILFAIFSKEAHANIYAIIGGALIIVYIFFHIKRPYFFHFETTNDKIIVRFYNPHPGLTKPKAYQIAIKELSNYKISKNFISKSISFEVKKGNKKGWYPPVSITLMTNQEIKSIEKELNTILRLKF